MKGVELSKSGDVVLRQNRPVCWFGLPLGQV